MKILKYIYLLLLFILVYSPHAQTENGIDPEVIIDRIVTIEKRMMADVKYITYDAEYVEGEQNDEGVFEEKIRFVKKIHIKYLADTAYMHEEYLEFYKDGKAQNEGQMKKESRDRLEKKKKRKSKDISCSLIEPFYPENRDLYEITYVGVEDNKIESYTCYHFKVFAKEESEELINGDFYFDTESFNPVKIDFTPAKLTKNLMFKMKELNMSVTYQMFDNSYWLPSRFDISGKGKAMFFIGVNFSGTEYYRSPVINDPDAEKYFEVDNGN